ncbi:hypothetical protein SHIRM173S_09670 [Streptomyces hirsutus]
MELGLVGLGKMGGNMRERIRRAGHTVLGYDRNPEPSADVHSLEELVGKLEGPARGSVVMVPVAEADFQSWPSANSPRLLQPSATWSWTAHFLLDWTTRSTPRNWRPRA